MTEYTSCISAEKMREYFQGKERNNEILRDSFCYFGTSITVGLSCDFLIYLHNRVGGTNSNNISSWLPKVTYFDSLLEHVRSKRLLTRIFLLPNNGCRLKKWLKWFIYCLKVWFRDCFRQILITNWQLMIVIYFQRWWVLINMFYSSQSYLDFSYSRVMSRYN